jgi:predicted TIM-barrel fold metal-dependent hydrolase
MRQDRDKASESYPNPCLFDAHLHVIDPRFPLTANQGYVPPFFTVADYLSLAQPLGVCGGAVVSGSFQAFDLGYLEDSLARLGPGYVGVTQLPLDTPAAEIARLHALGVRALRFNLHRGVQGDLAAMQGLARRAYEVAGWHTELYLDAAEIPRLGGWLGELPALCIDHLGLSRAGFAHLLGLVERGAWVKASGFGRLDFPVAEILAELCQASPHRVLWGSDLPGTRAPRPFEPRDLDLIVDTLADPALTHRVLYANALALYRPSGLPAG